MFILILSKQVVGTSVNASESDWESKEGDNFSTLNEVFSRSLDAKWCTDNGTDVSTHICSAMLSVNRLNVCNLCFFVFGILQLLPPNVTQTPEDVSANVNASSLVMTNAPALSPTGGADCQASQQQSGGAGGGGGGGGGGPGSGTGTGGAGGGGGDASTGALSPDALSQNSNAATGSAVAGAVAGPDAITGGSLDSSAVGTTPTTGSSCCENGRPIMTDPVSGQTVCSCQYDSARLALSSYSRLPAASVGVYGSPYPSTDQNPYQSIGVDSSAFYSPLVSESQDG